jgi:ketosteroid isomerase-like protein
MSQENVEIVIRLYEAWQREGFGVVPELMHPDIEWVNPAYAVEPGTRRGYDEFAAAAQLFTSVYRESRAIDATFHDAGERIAVKATMASRSTGSDVPIRAQRGYVFELRDGRVTRFAWFNDPAEALEAVGLEE